MATIAPVLPISRDERFGVASHTSILNNAKQNLKNLILTNPGERIDPNYGVGIKRFLFENITDSTLDTISNTIFSQVAKYLSSVRISNMTVQPSNLSENGITINITFSVAGSGVTTTTVSV